MPSPTWLHAAGSGPLPFVAVAIAPPTGSHVGVIYRDDADQARLLDLAFHHRVNHGEMPPTMHWMESQVLAELQPSVAAMCARVWKRCGRNIPYGFRYDATTFRTDGRLELGADERGLTCATFVLAIFRAAGVELLDLKTWQARSEDLDRFMELWEILEQHCDDKAHLAAVKAERNSIRYRPLEVAGGSSKAPPCGLEQAVAAAALIEQVLASA